ncbi:hypothetical protein GPZ77_03625 [Streptomyces sp. QHH-9511]|nr:hypothetical protein GPZ77_03625 [Streptomyces sp. QHH-9511]GGT78375.1 hypothetical protein GCM10010272_22480 [Streptomyces lateritius]
MPSPTTGADSLEATTAQLQAELPYLEKRRAALEEDIAAVTLRLESVRTALAALQALSTAGSAVIPEAEAEAEAHVPAARPAAPEESESDAAARVSRGTSATGRKGAPSLSDTDGLTDQVVAVLAGKAGTPMRAREVAAVLGRDGSTGAINTVRSTLDRLVATSRAHRAGRGLYQAPTV